MPPQDNELKTMPSSQRPEPPQVWLVSYSADDDRELGPPEIAQALKRGEINAQTIVWTDGMADWLPIAEVPELAKLLPTTGETAGAPAVMTTGMLGAGMSPSDQGQKAEKRPSTKPPLPGKARAPIDDEEPVSLVPESVHDDARASAAEPRALGAGTFGAPLIGDTGPGPDDEDIEPPPSSGTPSLHQLASLASPEGGSREDELLGLGGDSSLLAPPTIDISNLSGDPAPHKRDDTAEERTTTPPVSEGAAPFIPENRGAKPARSQSSPLPWVVALVACGLAAWALLFRGTPAATAPEPPAAVSPAPAPTPTPAPTAEAAEPTAEPAPSAEPAPAPSAEPAPAASAAPEEPDPEPEPEKAATNQAPETAAKKPTEPAAAAPTAEAPKTAPSPAAGPTTAEAPAPTAAEAPAPTAAEAPAEAPKEEVPTAGPFDRSAAAQSLSAQAGAASSCRKEGDPAGRALVTVVFTNSGRAIRATVDGPPFAGTATGGCIASTMRQARVPAFAGERVTVTKTVNIN